MTGTYRESSNLAHHSGSSRKAFSLWREWTLNDHGSFWNPTKHLWKPGKTCVFLLKVVRQRSSGFTRTQHLQKDRDDIPDRFVYTPTRCYFTVHLKTLVFMLLAICKCRNLVPKPLTLSPAFSAHLLLRCWEVKTKTSTYYMDQQAGPARRISL